MNIPMILFRKKAHKNVTQFAVEIRECFEVFLRGRPHRRYIGAQFERDQGQYRSMDFQFAS
jgi:hypothetical protein